MNLKKMSNNSSCANSVSEGEENNCAYKNYFKNSNMEIFQDGESSPSRNLGKIGDIVGIPSR